ncbi:5-oxoprolinase subunit C family protein [Aquibacillus rhizosphaerae]|uniref:Biotin-dependent carboxyltransferase family protein n=1 Tax=Aquibacillus rhizosphaerae TaxID=3051431 RepID=A0ABT7L3M6_9BACI|nr:biotin-dependent carboxyltransferase family protein [Aquibacillus sp. LR5S19]MDL4839196.1 biotin-dependent carboxyltransferase family protein [Aquibacillus sp. LR5S19]
MAIRIIEEGLQTTIQDLGRFGFQSLGFSTNGAIDSKAMRLANILLGNDDNEAVIEMSFIGPSISFESDMVIALTGANMSPKINGKPVLMNKVLAVHAGDSLQLRTGRNGLHTYLSVKGGFNIPPFLNSKSTALNVQVGGYEGRTLKAGDIIPIHTPIKSSNFNWGLGSTIVRYLNMEKPVIHFIEGQQYHWFTDKSIKDFESEIFYTTTQSNRMGYRLTGAKLKLKTKQNLITEATTFGTIQVPANGQPIVLMADSQPTGGYPKIGQVIQADIPKLSQLLPSQGFIFKKCSLEEAQALLYKKEQELNSLRAATQLKWEEWNVCTPSI